MGVPVEVLLMVVAAGLYLYDSALLLYVNEGVVFPGCRGSWQVAFGSDAARLRGRELYLPHPLLPHRPLFRLGWQYAPPPAGADTGWTARSSLYRPLAPLVWSMMLALFVLLPLGLFTRLGDLMVLLAITVLYASIVCALAWTAFNRARLGLPWRRYAGLAFECLACSPFALNLVRRLSIATVVTEDLVAAARRLQRDADWTVTRQQLVARLTEVIDETDPDAPRAATLRAYRQALLGEASSCRAPKSS